MVEKDFKYAAPSEVVGRAVEITKHAGFQYFNKLGMYVCVYVCIVCVDTCSVCMYRDGKVVLHTFTVLLVPNYFNMKTTLPRSGGTKKRK